jgi:hypothetical protein
MASYSLALDRASIVLLGKFNPVIFHPVWFARHSLIRDEEADQAKEILVSEAATKFKCEWLEIVVTTDRFQVLTDDRAHAAPLRDLVISVSALLEHTHVWALGMNRHLHYRLDSEEQWHRFGHFLAPKAHWAKFLTNPGMRSLTVNGTASDALGAVIQFQVEPSTRIHPGVYIRLNEHHEIPKDDDAQSKQELTRPEARGDLLEKLTKRWESAQALAVTSAESLLSEDY